MDVSKLESLYVCQAVGAVGSDGLNYVQMTLSRNHARRACNLRNVVADYNRMVETAFRVVPVVVPPNTEAVVSASALVASAISVGGGRWQWPEEEVRVVEKKEVKEKQRSSVGRLMLAGLVSDLGLDPAKVNMKGAEEEVHHRSGKGSDFNGRYTEADRPFLTETLRLFFAPELSYSVAPPRALPSHVRASLEGWMGDCLPDVMEREVPEQKTDAIIRDSHTKHRKKIEFSTSKPPQSIIIEYLREILEKQGECVLGAVEIKFALNRNQHHGVYKTTDACGFMRPFVRDGCVDMFCVVTKDKQPEYEFSIHAERLRAFLSGY